MSSALPSTKTEFVYRTIRKDILDGNLQPGQRLRLSEIAGRYEISEMPVREALRKLQHDGLVEFEDHRGATVSDLGLERIVEIIAVRTHLEVYAMCEAMPRHTPESLRQLDALLARMKKTRNPGQYSELNRRFHKLMSEPCPNAFLKAEIETLWNKVWRTRSESIFQLLPSRLDEATREHERMVEAMRRQSVDEVHRTAMSHRLRTLEGWQSLARSLQTQEASGESPRARPEVKAT